MAEIKVRGYKTPHPGTPALKSSAITPKAELRSGAHRSGSEALDTVTVDDRDLVELEFENGLRLWVRGDEYRERVEGAAVHRRAPPNPDESFDLPGAWNVPGMPVERGVTGLVLKALKVFGVDLAGQAAIKIAERFENPPDNGKRRKRRQPGFYRIGMETSGDEPDMVAAGPADVPTDKPVLILIHGTASSTLGSFGDLWKPERNGTLAALRTRYGKNVFAFEHNSFTASVIENALGLVEKLPRGAEIDLLTHSRGGLVGELVCRADVIEGPPFTDEEIKLAGKLDLDKRAAERAADAAKYQATRDALAKAQTQLKELSDELERKDLHVGTFVRVACPALGTTFVSGRLDRWFSALANLGQLALANTPAGQAIEELSDLILAVVNEKTDPATLPGLAFFLPDAGLIRVLNNPARKVASRLVAIAGDSDGSGVLRTLLMLALDAFYEGPHDIVVNTESMRGGAPRSVDAWVSPFKGPRVNHFSYFRNTESADTIPAAFAAEELNKLANLTTLTRPTRPIARGVDTPPPPADPEGVVFVLPGILGSDLADAKGRIWVDYWQLANGRFGDLAIDRAGVRALEPNEDYYGDLVRYLARTHEVRPFGFDWRRSPIDEAKRLAGEVNALLEHPKYGGLPIQFVAHSMGGLVVRSMIGLDQGDLWKALKKRDRCRLVMLGTPNGGSYAINELVVGQSRTLQLLGLLDKDKSVPELLEIVVRFPGVLAMLPDDGDGQWFKADTWSRFAQFANDRWIAPAAKDLDGALDFRKLIAQSPVDQEAMCYVAGCAPETVSKMEFAAGEFGETVVVLEGTTDGDGRVTWESGIPPELKHDAYYMPVEHGELSRAAAYFPAILDLLRDGKTDALPKSPPAKRAASGTFEIRRAPPQSLPDPATFEAEAMGGAVPRATAGARTVPVCTFTVVNGDLTFADHPVMVGHYIGDALVSAEAELDAALGGCLRQLYALQLYPGEIGTSEVVLVPNIRNPNEPKGALVVGLGQPGVLSVERLRATLLRALLHHASRYAQYKNLPAGGAAPLTEIALASLLVGSQAGGVRVTDAALALVDAVARANAALEDSGSRVRIGRMQIMELWEDRALVAANALGLLKSNSDLASTFAFDGLVINASGARKRLMYEEPTGWWQRLQILGAPPRAPGEPDPGPDADGDLRFMSLTARARAEVRTTTTQRRLVDEFVKRAIKSSADDRTLGGALFELLIPNELKDRAPDEDNLLYVLDESAARYPWELLEDPMLKERKPLATSKGMLRQLETSRFRSIVRGSIEESALVIGDPILPSNGPLRQLRGAREEATAVAAVLRKRRFERVTTLVGPSAVQVIKELYARPYRILHLAGHGVYEYDDAASAKPAGDGMASAGVTPATGCGRKPRRATGMVIGDKLYLTPQEVEQMRIVPELVFINCCYLGRIEDRNPVEFNRLAANVSTQFIRMGVRAVVAAGWAVDDHAAKTFAETFYDRLLAGDTFGTAVQCAREATWKKHPGSNTWGAYQCYGDPDFRLRPLGGGNGGGFGELHSEAAALHYIDDVRSQLTVGAARPIGALLERLRLIREKVAERGWQKQPRILLALGRAYAEAHAFDEAIACFDALLKAGREAVCEVRDLEQVCNYITRNAVYGWIRDGRPGNPGTRLDEIERAIAQLKWLNSRGSGTSAGTPAETVERLNLLGSAYKRKAWITQGKARRDALLEMYGFYKRAAELAAQSGKQQEISYGLINEIQSALVLEWQGVPGGEAPRDAARLAGLVSALEQDWARDRNPWTRCSQCDAQLTEALVDGQLEAELEGLAARYLDARTLMSPRQFASSLDQIRFLAEMAVVPDLAEEDDRRRSLRIALQKLATRLGGTGTPGGSAGPEGGGPGRPGEGGPPPLDSGPTGGGAPPPASGAEPPESPRGESALRGGGPELAAAPRETDVKLGAAAPDSAAPGEPFAVRFVAYPDTPEEEQAARDLLRTASPSAIPILGKLSSRWADGTEVTVRASGDKLEIRQPEKRFVWRGERQSLDFLVTIDRKIRAKKAFLQLDVLVAGLVIGDMILEIAVTRGERRPPARIKTVDGQVVRSAFASYSSRDRDKVALIVGALEQVKIDFFLDCLDINPSEEWKERLRTEIAARDRLWLFWSKSSAASRWVDWEWRTALADKGIGGIQAYAIEPDVPAPQALSKLQFNNIHALISQHAAGRAPK